MVVLLALTAGLVAGLLLGLIAGRLLARRDEQLLLSCFEGLASRALAGTRDEAGRELDSQRLAVDQLLTPLRHQLALVEAQLRGLEVERARAHAQLQEQVSGVRRSSELLGRETATLVDALRRPQARGRWGEVQLRRCVEFAGMVERCDFTDQASMIGVDGSVLRPDLVIRLSGGRSVVVDAKVTLAAYLEAIECDEDKQAHERMAAHARHLRQHVDRLAEKSYWAALPDSPEFVVLFLPGEAFLAPALEHDPALLEHAYARRVHLATPTTLISLLRTVAHSWQQEALTDNARAVVTAGKELCSRLGVLGAHVDKLGRSLGTAVTDFNKTVGSLERTLLPAARTLAELSLSEPPDAPARISALPRPLSAPELVAPVTDVRQAAG
ncbi:MAG: DNA recombination protein RmuC [Actinomycetota bacterium]|nr:DNA recombination protein RmuC [Actinomycetota bacterium]